MYSSRKMALWQINSARARRLRSRNSQNEKILQKAAAELPIKFVA
jgi:hypothetical protein